METTAIQPYQFVDIDFFGRTIAQAVRGIPMPLDKQACILSPDVPLTDAEITKKLDEVAQNACQSPIGRKQLEWARDNGVKIIYDCTFGETRLSDGSVNIQAGQHETDASGSCVIRVNPRCSEANLENNILEEIQHEKDLRRLRELGFEGLYALSLRSRHELDQALEASAAVTKVMHREQCFAAHQVDPKRFIPPGALSLSAWHPECCKVAKENAKLLQAGRTTSFAAKIFSAYYEEDPDGHEAQMLAELIEDFPVTRILNDDSSVSILLDGHECFLRSDSISHQLLSKVFEIDGQGYLHLTHLNLDDDRHATLENTPKVVALLDKLSVLLRDDQGYAGWSDHVGQDMRPTIDIGVRQPIPLGPGQEPKAVTPLSSRPPAIR